MINGLQYQLVTPKTGDLLLNIDGQDLHLIRYRLSILHQLGNNWSILALLSPTLSSTFNSSLEGDDFIMNGGLQFIKRRSEHFSYGFGVVRTVRFGEPLVVPALQMTLTSERSKFQIFLPRSITYDRFYGDLTVGLQLSVSGSEYNANYDRITDLNVEEPVDKLAYTRVLLGPTIKYHLTKMLRMEAAGGISPVRQVELQSNVFQDESYDIETGPFFRLSISVVPPIKDSNE